MQGYELVPANTSAAGNRRKWDAGTLQPVAIP